MLSNTLENLSTTATNILSIIPCYLAYNKGDYLTLSLTAFAAASSAISHLFESHKHGMYGFGCSPKISYILNRVDTLGSYALFGRIAYLAYSHPNSIREPFTIISSLSAFIFMLCLRISEHDHTPTTKCRYLVFHNIWHTGIFSTLGYYLYHLYKHI